ncbi:conserved hypothetical protein [Acidobacteriia bacterium SbA2]|nr:conserved hypothetical protein [Acidobacteriia bacterium SbA2]
MEHEVQNSDALQGAYQAAVDLWIAAIRDEQALASLNDSVAEVDTWEGAGFRAEELRAKAKAAKAKYQDALRYKFFGIPQS